jgi:prepilin-type processing-associated H-X9-DG protein
VARSYAITAGIKKFKSHNGLSRVRQMAEPSSTILFTEENDWAVPGYSRAGYDDTYFAAFPAPRNAIASFHLVNERHRNEGVGNCAFFDGHVAAHSIAETTNLAYNYQ